MTAGAALAQVAQPAPDNTPLPQPTPDAELGVVRSRGFQDNAVTLAGLFFYRGENLDPVADAGIWPGVFSPLCGFTGELVMRGGGCMLPFGWYNVTGAPPTDREIYELVPANASEYMSCQDGDFCPLATMETTQVGQHQWTPTTFSALDIREDPRYLGGLIGFAIIATRPDGSVYDGRCDQTKFSQAELNTICDHCTPAGSPWIGAIIYQSTATPDAFYIGFEDQRMSPSDWTNGGNNDGDFNDFVFFITGLTCEGGGQPCDTGLIGACGAGRTDCARNGESPCRQIVQPSAEICDNIDCVEACGYGEFECDANTRCEDGYCIDPDCVGVDCTDGQVCREGQCVGGCDPSVQCPPGQECQLGRCVDLCAYAECPPDNVCERGVCLPSCHCRVCAAGQTCAADGHCVDAGCESMDCGVGQFCQAGACVDACAGVVCPGGAVCVAGVCGDPLPGGGSTGGTGGSIATGGSGGLIDPGVSGTGAQPGTSGGTGAAAAPAESSDQPGCGCRTASGGDARSRLGWSLLALLAVLVRRRRRRVTE
jgi:MYXO-CTERM domain-containing protein